MAEETDEPDSTAPAGQDAVVRGVQAPAGMLSARVLLDVNLSSDQLGEPISLAPNVYYAFSDRFQLGIVHDGPMGWQGRAGSGLCLTGEDGGCPKVYNNLGLDVMYGLAFDALDLSAHASFYLRSFDPTTSMLALGFTGKLHASDNFAVLFDPQVGVALNDRDLNDDLLFVPLELQYQVRLPTTIKLLTGVTGSLQEFGDTYEVPMGVGLLQNVTEHVDVGFRVSFDNLLGQVPDGGSRTDTRSLALLLSLRN